MKKKILSYDSWKCITEKKVEVKFVERSDFSGYVIKIDIVSVTEPQCWDLRGRRVCVCDDGFRWLIMLPKDEYYCVTAMSDGSGRFVLWYVDMILSQGVEDGIPYFWDLYLDLIVTPDGQMIEDDRDELDSALSSGEITAAEHKLALDTAKKLKTGLLSDIEALSSLTERLNLS